MLTLSDTCFGGPYGSDIREDLWLGEIHIGELWGHYIIVVLKWVDDEWKK